MPAVRRSHALVARRGGRRSTRDGHHQQVQAEEDHEHTRRLRTVRTFSPKDSDITRRWHVIDASDVVLGRLASQVAVLLRGKHKPIFAPHVDTGDFVIVVNAAKVSLSGSKLEQKDAYRDSGYPGGLRAVSYASLMESHPERDLRRVDHDHEVEIGRAHV